MTGTREPTHAAAGQATGQQPRRWTRTLGVLAGYVVWMLAALVTAPVLLYADGHGGGAISGTRWLLLGGWLALGAATFVLPRGPLRPAARALCIALVWIAFLGTPPSNTRDWAPVAERLPGVSIEGTRVAITNVRNFRHEPDGSFQAGWYDATYDVSEIVRGYFVLTEFGGFDGIAHVMASFEFEGNRFVVFSAEIRREQGETYDPIGGMFRQYELMYVIADERDAIALRTNVHGDPTWVFPIEAGRDATGRFFLDMAERARQLQTRPEWYHTFGNSCASNLAGHYERVNDVALPLDYRIALPGYSEELVAALGLLPDGVALDDARRRYQVNERALADGNSDHFSDAIRSQ